MESKEFKVRFLFLRLNYFYRIGSQKSDPIQLFQKIEINGLTSHFIWTTHVYQSIPVMFDAFKSDDVKFIMLNFRFA